jgi:2-amino-4-hydroxy-6-hydroxymethyldihydropteridine diphosphokinase
MGSPADDELNDYRSVAIALGSNLGDSRAILEGAIEWLDRLSGITVVRRSQWYRTAPVGPPQPDYLNGCAILHVDCRAGCRVDYSPQDLLAALLHIEQEFGRVRGERWGPRTLDLDLLLFDRLILDTPTLQIPHPRMRERAFVLVPLAEIAPDWIDPISGKSIVQLCEELHEALN